MLLQPLLTRSQLVLAVLERNQVVLRRIMAGRTQVLRLDVFLLKSFARTGALASSAALVSLIPFA